MAVLDTRIQELIAVGASVTANCTSCLEFHVAKAKEAGASSDEIREAVGVGRRVRTGAAAKLDRTAGSLLAGEPAPAAAADCGCAA